MLIGDYHGQSRSATTAVDSGKRDGLKHKFGLYLQMKHPIGEHDVVSSSPLADDGLLQTSDSHNQPAKRLETIMRFGHQSDVHKHLSPKRLLFSDKITENDMRNRIVEPVQNEQMRLSDPPTTREEPMSTRSSS
jgi:hypothetical protein